MDDAALGIQHTATLVKEYTAFVAEHEMTAQTAAMALMAAGMHMAQLAGDRAVVIQWLRMTADAIERQRASKLN